MNIGVFDVMQERSRIHLKRFAEDRDLDFPILEAVCDYMTLMGVFKKEGEHYLLDKRGEFFVSYLLGWFDLVHGYEETLHYLEDLITKKRVYGQDLYRRPEHVARGSGEASKLLYFPIMIDLVRSRGYKKVLDLGCGDGTFLIELCRKAGQMNGMGVDIAEEAIESGVKKIHRCGVSDRIRLTQGDVLKLDELPQDFRDVDAATVFFVLHEFLSHSEDKLIELLKNFRRHVKGADLLVCEAVWHDLDELPSRPGPIAEYQFFHCLSGQKVVRREVWRDLFRAAGFGKVEEHYLEFARTVIYVLGDA
jgi:2-ketoarginine methyltransferase